MRLSLPALLLGLAACASSPGPDPALTVVPYEIAAGGRVVVEVGLNGQGPFRFAVDTAATSSFLFGRALDALGLVPEPGLTAIVYGAVATGSFPVVILDRAEIGSEVWNKARLVALPSSGNATAMLDGVLGADFLRRYTVSLVVADRSLGLYRPESLAARRYQGWTVLELTPRQFGASPEPLHFLEVTIGGHSIPGLFDLGAGVSVLNVAAARALRLAPTRMTERGVFRDAVGNEPVMAELATQTVETGNARWRNESFLIQDLEIFSTLDSADEPLAILGSGLFTQRDLIIDLARERLLIRTAMAEAEP